MQENMPYRCIEHKLKYYHGNIPKGPPAEFLFFIFYFLFFKVHRFHNISQKYFESDQTTLKTH